MTKNGKTVTRLLPWVLATASFGVSPTLAQQSTESTTSIESQAQIEAMFDACVEKPAVEALADCQTMAAIVHAEQGVPGEIVGAVIARLRDVLLELGRYAEAEPLAREALRVIETTKGRNSRCPGPA